MLLFGRPPNLALSGVSFLLPFYPDKTRIQALSNYVSLVRGNGTGERDDRSIELMTARDESWRCKKEDTSYSINRSLTACMWHDRVPL
jgi:hypothetical protein